MAKEEKPQEKKEEKDKVGESKKHEDVKLIRILEKDIPGTKKVYAGLTRVKGVSWAFANALCKKLGIDKTKRVQDLSKEEIEKIKEFIKNPDVPDFLKNRRKDFDTGEDKHLHGSDLDLRKDFDIKRLKKIKCYKGARHTVGLPVRGQRTRSNFRRNRRKSGAVGVSKKAAKQTQAKEAKEKTKGKE